MKSLQVLVLLIFFISIASTASISGKEQGRNIARIDATLKSYLGNPLTGLVYAASLAIGAISMLAMYESPLSPLSVPSLPKPPQGRFPPQHSIWPQVENSVRSKQANPPFAASVSSPVYVSAPLKSQSILDQNNQWFSNQNLVHSLQSALASNQMASTGGPYINFPNGSRRQDLIRAEQIRAAQLQGYIDHMSKVPATRAKLPGETQQTAHYTTSAPKVDAETVQHSIAPTESSSTSPIIKPKDDKEPLSFY